jgi:hypothetical protein
MIVCPNCQKENADESVHCGFCGQQLKEDAGGKKTMFGLNALSSVDIQKAAQEAKAAAAQAAQNVVASKPSLPVLPSLTPDGENAAFARTEMMPSITPEAAASHAATLEPTPVQPVDPFAADFAALEQNFGSDAPVNPAPSVELPSVDYTPKGFGDAPAPAFPSSIPSSSSDDFSMGNVETDKLHSGPQSFGTPQGTGGTPQGFGGAPQGFGESPQGFGGAPQGTGGAPQGFGAPASGAQPNPGMLQPAPNQNLQPAKSNKKLIIGLVVVEYFNSLFFRSCYIAEKVCFCLGSSQFYEKIIAEGLLAQPMLSANTCFRYLFQSNTRVLSDVADAAWEMSCSTINNDL